MFVDIVKTIAYYSVDRASQRESEFETYSTVILPDKPQRTGAVTTYLFDRPDRTSLVAV